MPRYYFDLTDGGRATTDEEGLELPSLEAATSEAVCSLGEFAREVCGSAGLRRAPLKVRVRNAQGEILSVEFKIKMVRGDA